MTAIASPPERPESLNGRIRALSLAESLRLARAGNYSERVALERMHGKLVWEALLRNPGLTIPEVGRIAGMGTLPRGLVDLICGNPAWVSSEEVRRKLLSNPRLRGQNLMKVLRALSKAELALLPSQTAYPYAVREAAKRLLQR